MSLSAQFEFVVFSMMLLSLPILSGCSCSFDPEKTVTIEISGQMSDTDREDLLEELKGMTDTGNHMMQHSSSGNLMTVKLQPVSDPEAFAKKVKFGRVTEVSGRTVKVAYDPNP